MMSSKIGLRTASKNAIALRAVAPQKLPGNRMVSFAGAGIGKLKGIPGRVIPTTSRPSTMMTRRTATTSSSSPGAASGKSQADQIVEELEDLYLTAKDEFEIATDSTDSATVYAESDRESAQEALRQLVSVYVLYTNSEVAEEATAGERTASELDQDNTQNEENGGRVTLEVNTNFDPTKITDDVRREVKKRAEQRVRELEAAVQALEERASND